MHSSVSRRRMALAVVALFGLCAAGCGDDIACGDGTKLDDGACVPDLTGDWDPTRPAVQLLEVVHMHILEEGKRPIYLRHPLHLQVGLDVIGEAFTTDLVLGFESADGKKRCVAGHAELTHAGREEIPDAKAPPTSVRVEVDTRIYVQAFCEVLAGEKDVRAWLAIDPFGLLRIQGRKLGKAGDGKVDMTKFIHGAAADLSNCSAPEGSGHAENCVTSLEVATSPGADIQMLDVDLSSSVVLASPKPPKAPDLFANTQVILYGVDDANNPLDDEGQVDLGFRVRPDIDPIDLPEGASLADYDWQPLIVLLSQKEKDGDPTLKELRAQFLASLEAAVQKMTDSALRFPQKLRNLMNKGKWAPFSKYQILACAEPPFEEAKAKGIDHANNCALASFVAIRHGKPGGGGPVGGHDEYQVKETEYMWDEDPKDEVNTCATDGSELRPECTFLGQHKDETYCYEVPKYKVTPLVDEDKCHCCYPPSSFDVQVVMRHAPSARGGFGDDDTVALRSGIWFDVDVKKSDMFSGKPHSLGHDLGTDIRIHGWWDSEIVYIGAPMQLGLQPGIESYWWPELRLFGFALYSLKIAPEGAEWKLPLVPEKKWSVDYCQVFCATFACFECCAGFGGGVGLDTKAIIDEPGKKLAGIIEPFIQVDASGSAGIHLGVGVAGLEVVFDPLVGFRLPFESNLTLVVEDVALPVKLALTANFSVKFVIALLAGKINGFFKPLIGAKAALTLYEWEPLEYWFDLWGTAYEWKFEL